jgi:sec-independent protein translocase protein TatA
MPGLFGHWYVLLIILAIVLIVYGPGKLPEVGGAIGKAMREFRKQSSEFTDEIKKSTTVNDPQPSAEAKPTGEVATGDPKPATDIKS